MDKIFNISDKIQTPKGPGVIKSLKKSTYSNKILFYLVELDSGEQYICSIVSAKQLK